MKHSLNAGHGVPMGKCVEGVDTSKQLIIDCEAVEIEVTPYGVEIDGVRLEKLIQEQMGVTDDFGTRVKFTGNFKMNIVKFEGSKRIYRNDFKKKEKSYDVF